MSETETPKVNQEPETQVATIDDLPVAQSKQDEVKGGVSRGEFGLLIEIMAPATKTTVINHNETMVSDEAGEDKDPTPLADLEPNSEVKGGGVTGAGVLTLNGGTLDSQSSTGIRRLDGFVVTFDRPIDS